MSASVFYPDTRSSNARAVLVAAAKAVCAPCPVREPCLEAGMSERRGIWGGLTASERHPKRRTQRPGMSA